MKSSEELACRAAHLVGLAGDFIDWTTLDDEEFRHLIELVDVTQPEMSDALFEALSRLLQGDGLGVGDSVGDLAQPHSDPLYGAAEEQDQVATRPALSPARLFATASLRVIRGGRE